MPALNRHQRRHVLKRQRERVYLEHFLAVRQLAIEQLIEGRDDGHEPDFSVQMAGQWIGIELTTLPRLRERVGNHALWWRWQYWKLIRQLGWPFAGRRRHRVGKQPTSSTIEQADIDAVMQKKAPKLPHYRDRRPLDQVWLLIHTDQQQADGQLQVSAQPLTHHSLFEQVWLSVYPARLVLPIQRRRTDDWHERWQHNWQQFGGDEPPST